MSSLKKVLIDTLQAVDDDAPDEEIRNVIITAAGLKEADTTPKEEFLYAGWKRSLITFLGVMAVGLAIGSVFAVRISKEAAVYVYMFWAIAPPSWFFVEWVWLFKSHGDSHRLDQFKTTIDIAQKFWAGVLALLAVEMLLAHGWKF